MSKKKIPKGWIDYLPFGDRVEGTKLFPFKTPLKWELQCSIPKQQRFTPACLIATRPKVRAVIDLTDTDARANRYYSPKDFIDANVEHLKMRIAGGGLVPGMHEIKMFSNAVDGFMEKFADDPDALIGVHCTHGLNRTGYFICMYMVTRLGFSPIEAIDNFQKARGYEMYRQNFLEEIMEPGKHTSGHQTPLYKGGNKLVRTVGNYHYENTWIEDNPTRSSGEISQADISGGGKGRRRNRGRQNWREENMMRERSQMRRDQRVESYPNEGGPSPIGNAYQSSHHHGRQHIWPEENYTLRHPFMGPMEHFEYDRRIEDTAYQAGQGFPQERDTFPIRVYYANGRNTHFPVGVGNFPHEGVEGESFSQGRLPPSFDRSQGVGFPHASDYVRRYNNDRIRVNREPSSTEKSPGIDCPPLGQNLRRQQFPYDGVQGPERPLGGICQRPEDFSGQRMNIMSHRNQMEYRSPLEEDGFQKDQTRDNRRRHRDRRTGRNRAGQC